MNSLEFGLLGPLLVRRDGKVTAVRRGHQRALLTVLLLNANRTVTLNDIADVLWDAAPPPSAEITIRNYVKRLRQALGDADRTRISTQPRGYLITVSDGDIDVSRFEALLAAARASARDGRWDLAADQARAALSLWRGEPLADVESDMLVLREVPRLAEMRLQALETRIDAEVHLGRHDEVIVELRRLIEAYPLREPFHVLLMLALYRHGQQGEALAAYQHARRLLAQDLGVEPGAELRALHQRMLSADPALDAPERARPTSDPVPRELPAAPARFTGRAAELAALTGMLDQAGTDQAGTDQAGADQAGADQASTKTPRTVVIAGMAGVGKTALAVHWAHQATGSFPDGQLYVNLRGYDPDQPVTAADALARFLRALGVHGEDIPPDDDERAARYRSRLAGRRMLIVLDNAGSAGQVRPLLPGTASCAVVVTSRDTLAGLVARDGAARLDLNPLAFKDAVGLLRVLIGARADADPAAAALLAEQCNRLPLALRVAAELAGTRGDVPLARLVDELADQQQRLSLLDADGDPGTAIRAVFSWSYRHLDVVAARTFRLAGLHPGADFDPHAIAALTGATVADSRGVLDLLAGQHLIQQTRSGRYGMHDLLRAYAREQAAQNDQHDQDGQHVALTRLLDYYLHSAATAMDTLYPAERHYRPRIPPTATPAPPVTEPAAARAWLDAERANLVAITAHAAGHGWPAHATRLATTSFRYLAAGSYSQEAIVVYTHACAAARRSGDHAAEATALFYIASVHWQQSRYQQATDHLQQALVLFRQIGDRVREASTLGNLGIICASQARYQEACTLHAQAQDIYRQTGDLSGEMHCLMNLGDSEERQGRYQQAARHLRQSLAIARKFDDRYVECTAVTNLGTVRMRQGDLHQAAGCLDQALALCRETSDRYQQADALTRIGDVRLRQGRLEEARDRIEEGLALYQEIGDRSGQADALNSLGEALLTAGQPDAARTHHAAAGDIASEIGDEYQRARAHDGVARAHHALASPDQARDHWATALALYTDLGTPEADQVRARLANHE